MADDDTRKVIYNKDGTVNSVGAAEQEKTTGQFQGPISDLAAKQAAEKERRRKIREQGGSPSASPSPSSSPSPTNKPSPSPSPAAQKKKDQQDALEGK